MKPNQGRASDRRRDAAPMILAGLLLLAVSAGVSRAEPFADYLSSELARLDFRSQSGPVTMYIPSSLNHEAGVRRLTESTIHQTLYYDQKRVDAYHAAFLEIALQQAISDGPFDRAVQALDDSRSTVGTATTTQDVMLGLAEQVYARHGTKTGARYIKNDGFLSRLANKMKMMGRRGHKLGNCEAFNQVMAGIAVADITGEAAELVIGAAALTALNHDLGYARLGEVERALREAEQKQVSSLDPALWEGLKLAKIDLAALRDAGAAGAFVVELNRRKEKLLLDIPAMGGALLEAGAAVSHTSTAFSGPGAVALAITYQTIMDIVGQEREAQEATALGTVFQLLGTSSMASDVVRQARAFAQHSFFLHMTSVLKTSPVVWLRRALDSNMRDYGDFYEGRARLTREMTRPVPVPAEIAAGLRAPEPTVPGAPVSRDGKVKDSVLFILDTSGSMQDALPGNGSDPRSKLEIAKEALAQVAGEIAAKNAHVEWALMVYRDCEDTPIVVDFTRDSDQIRQAAANFEGAGKTPIEKSLRNAASYIRARASGRKARIVLLSDGEETCGGNPATAAREIVSGAVAALEIESPKDEAIAGGELMRALLPGEAVAATGCPIVIDVIGFDIGAGFVGDQLRSVAVNGRGKYVTANSIQELEQAVREVVVVSGNDSAVLVLGLMTVLFAVFVGGGIVLFVIRQGRS